MYLSGLTDPLRAGEMWLVPPELPNVPVPPSRARGLPPASRGCLRSLCVMRQLVPGI